VILSGRVHHWNRLHVVEHSNAQLLKLPLLGSVRQHLWKAIPVSLHLAEVIEFIIGLSIVLSLLVTISIISGIQVLIEPSNKALIFLLVLAKYLLLYAHSIPLPALFLFFFLSLLVEAFEPEIHLCIAHQVLVTHSVVEEVVDRHLIITHLLFIKLDDLAVLERPLSNLLIMEYL